MVLAVVHKCVMRRPPKGQPYVAETVRIGRRTQVWFFHWFFNEGGLPVPVWSTGTGLIVQPGAKHGNRYHR